LKRVVYCWSVVAACALSLLLAAHAAAGPGAGDLDASFGNGGITTTVIGDNSSGLLGIALQPDGKVIGFGQADYAPGKTGFALTRYLNNGTLDLSFGGGGIVETGLGSLDDEA